MADCGIDPAAFARLCATVDALARRMGVDPNEIAQELDEYSDINPARLYSVADLVKLRGGSRQSYYQAIKRGTLRETVSGGRKAIRGSDAIAWFKGRARYTYPQPEQGGQAAGGVA